MRQQRFGNEDARRVDGRTHSGIYLSATFNTKNGRGFPPRRKPRGRNRANIPKLVA